MFNRLSLICLILSLICLSNIQSQTYQIDSLIVREILDRNNLLSVNVADVSTKAPNGRIETLNLRKRQIINLLPELGNLNSLNSLLLDSNFIDSLPSTIGNLSQLVQLDISNNALLNFPTSIGKLKNLLLLSASNNKINALPREVLGLDNLSYLFLDRNEITQLPDEIGGIVFLNTLDLTANSLTSIPSTLSILSLLETLNLDFNQLEKLPEEIIQLNALKTLSLSNNKLCSLSVPQASWATQFNPGWNNSQSCLGNVTPGSIKSHSTHKPYLKVFLEENGQLSIDSDLPRNIPVNILIYDAKGKIVLEKSHTEIGLHAIPINAPASHGLFWLRIQAKGQERTAMLIL